MQQLLSGIRVIDLTRLTPGGYCTMMLADSGADVIKVEQPGTGDYARWGEGRVGSQAISFYVVNRNKRSVALDLKAEGDRAALQRLVETADVVVEAFRPGVAERLGISHEQLRAIKPDIVSCSISGFGQTGPWRGRAGHDINYMARTGALDLVRDKAGDPVLPGVWLSDYAAGLMAAFAIVSALLGRERGGEGDAIDISMSDVVTQWLGDYEAAVLAGEGDRPVAGEHVWLGGCGGYNVYRTADGGHMALGAEEPRFWSELCRRIGRDDLVEHDPLAVGEPGARLKAEVAAAFATRTRAEWEDVFADGAVPCDPVLSLEEALAAEHPRAREMLIATQTVEGDDIAVPGFPVKYARHPCAVTRRAPDLGEHDHELLGIR